MTMITFDHDGDRFTLRSVGVALDNDRVLLQQDPNGDFWFLPGGRCELRETAIEALQREMMEELSIVVMVEQLLWVVENFFEFDGHVYHELGLYWLMRLPEEWLAVHRSGPIIGIEGDVPMVYQWFDHSEIESIILHPEFLRTALYDLPNAPQHVVHRD
ncbi:MAG: NUDIX domain-containing protein [Anaerolineae bacterium]|nr:NUDIX domain-containing protein [Anaerolineae bacterium]